MIDLSQSDLSIVKEILHQYLPNVPVWVFGSRVNGTASQFSDLDLALITKQPLSILQYAELKEAFSNSDLECKVDLIDWCTVDEAFKKNILNQYEIL